MDGQQEKPSIDSVRRVMLRQEQIFKQQVKELHRLYRTQKRLMIELQDKDAKYQTLSSTTPTAITQANSRYWSSTSISESRYSIDTKHFHIAQPKSEHNSSRDYRQNGQSLVTRSYLNLEKSSQGDQSTHVKDGFNIIGPQLWTDKESELDLTLRIGCRPEKKKISALATPRYGFSVL